MRKLLFATIAAAALAGMAACTVHQTEAPPLTGPSTFALAVNVTATPDSIIQNGTDQSTLKVVARDYNGRPVPNLGVALQVTSNGVPNDYGTLSAKTVYTGSDGTATATYTAPPAPIASLGTVPACHGLAGPCVTIYANPIGTNFQATQYNVPSVDIRLAPPPTAPVDPSQPYASITVSNATPAAKEDVTFIGTASRAASGHNLVSWKWEFSDGTIKYGSVITHDFDPAGTYYVTLTVTDDAGNWAQNTGAITAK
jgi:PKD repeat protein